MEKETDEENSLKKHNLTVITPDWLDLPEPIVTNIILNYLEIVDYIRFSAVCKKWRLIQKEHRILYSPYAPPLPLSFPWLCCSYLLLNNDEDRSFRFYLPGNKKSCNMPLYRAPAKVYIMGYKHGWLLLLNNHKLNWWLCFMNPITGAQIKLPPLIQKGWNYFYTTHISSPPTDPECTVLLKYFDSNGYLCRLNDNTGWKIIDYSKKKVRGTALFYNKIYSLTACCETIYVVDTLLPYSVEQKIEMDCSEICMDSYLFRLELVNILEELIMVIIVYGDLTKNDYDTIKEFLVYRADFSINMWVRMESVYDHALFFSSDIIFSVPAVDVRCQKNAIYCTEGFKYREVAWRAYDLSIKDWIDGPYMPLSSKKYSWSWFLPTLDSLNLAKTNGAW